MDSLRTRRAITDQDRVDIAVARYTTDEKGKLPTLAALEIAFDRNPSVLSRACAEALQRGLVRLQCFPSHTTRRLEDLESALEERFKSTLEQAIVVENPVPAHQVSPRALGQALASIIAKEKLMFRDGDTVGIGGGRCVFEVGRALITNRTVLGVNNIHVLSMTGDTFARSRTPGEYIPGALEADFHAGEFASAFPGKSSVFRLVSTIVLGESGSLGDAVPCDFEQDTEPSEWSGQQPDIALLGAGTLSADHHWAREIQARSEGAGSGEKRLDPIIPYLTPLVRICERFREQYGDEHVPIAEVCNNFFIVDAPPALRVAVEEIRAEAQSSIDDANRRLLTFDKDRLAAINRIFLIAGGGEKARTVYHLLTKWPNVRLLCTDQKCAERILTWKD